MAKLIFTDLHQVNQVQIINLKSTAISSLTATNYAQLNKPLPQNNQEKFSQLDLTNTFPGAIYSQKTDKKNLKVDALSPLKLKKKTQPTLFFPSTKIQQNLFSKKVFSSLKVAAFGLLIAFTLNIFNVLNNGYTFKNSLVSQASAGLGSITAGANNLKQHNFNLAEGSFNQAQQNFDQALQQVTFLTAAPGSALLAEKNTKSLQNLLEAGQNLSKSGQYFTQAADSLKNLPIDFLKGNQEILKGSLELKSAQKTALDQNKKSLTDQLKVGLEKLNQAASFLQAAQANLQSVDASLLPAEYQSKLEQARVAINQLAELIPQLQNSMPAILKLFGDRYPHRYVILLQNDAEARPTGGFIGSLIIFDLNEGHLSRLDFHDVYQYDGQLLEKITPPEEIAGITDSWFLRDSNYSPNFAISAEKAAWFLQKSKGPSVDTVIAVNLSVVTDLLHLTGPLQVDSLKAPLSADSFAPVLSYLIESKWYGKADPKVILQKTIQAFFQEVISKADFSELIRTLLVDVDQKKIQFYSRDKEVQALFDQLKLTPRTYSPQADQDYLQVISTSISGNKSDAYIKQNLSLQTYISSDGSIANELTITRQHTWSDLELEHLKATLKQFGYSEWPDYLVNILGGGSNKSSIRIYLPLGTEFENVTGLEKDQIKIRSDAELNKTYLTFPFNLSPGEEKSITLRYRLPFKLNLLPADLYQLFIEPQSAFNLSDFTQKLNLSPDLTKLRETKASNSPALNSLKYFSAVIGK